MYCLACHLHFPDHLNYCKHCGRPLTHASVEAENEGTRCTRCGTRIIPGENFCQQCGARATSKSEDTSIGMCHNCGVLWRSTWLFCNHCGMARTNALVTSAAPPLPASSVPTVAINIFQPEVELAEADAAKPHCPYCAAEVTPNSRFCEACGGKLRTATTGDLNPPLAAHEPRADELTDGDGALEAQAQAPAPPLLPALTDGPIAAKAAPRAEEKTAAARAPELAAPAVARDASAAQRETVEMDAVASTNKIEPAKRTTVDGAREPAHPVTVVTQLAPAISASAPLRESRRRNARAAWTTAGFIGLAILLLLVAGVIVKRTLLKKRASVTPAPSVAQPTTQPMPEVAPPAPSPSANAAPAPPAGMVYVPGGTFQMGRDDGDEFERPAHAVTVAPFFLDRTEVTNEQYQEFIKQTGYRAPEHWKNGSYAEGAGRLPVVNVSWEDANEYARWAGKRLPTEEEWEFAARGTDGRLYPWGSEWDPNLANTEESQRGRFAEAGSYSAGASPYGALDMCGNAWEWTASNVISYAVGGQELAERKVIRGGSFSAERKTATATYRGIAQTKKGYDETGFRCARDLQ